MKQLRIRTLAAVFVVAGVLSWAGARLWDAVGTLPRVPLAAPIVLALIAVVLLSWRSRCAPASRPSANAAPAPRVSTP